MDIPLLIFDIIFINKKQHGILWTMVVWIMGINFIVPTTLLTMVLRNPFQNHVLAKGLGDYMVLKRDPGDIC